MSRYIVARANALVFGVLILILLIISIATWDRFSASSAARAWTEHTYDVLADVAAFDLAYRSAESAQRAYMLHGAQSDLTAYQVAARKTRSLLERLKDLTSDNPIQQQRLTSLKPLLQDKMNELAEASRMRGEQGLAAALAVPHINAGRPIETMLAAMNETEQQLLARRLHLTDERGVWLRALVFGGALVAIVSLLWAANLLNQALRRSSSAEAEQRTLALRLTSSLNSLSQGVGVFTPDHRLTDWNNCFQLLLDLPAGMVARGTAYAAIVTHAAVTGHGTLEPDTQIRRPSTNSTSIYELSHRSGLREVCRTPMPDGGFVLTITDMTKRAEAEAVLRESQKMQAIGQLTGGIAHDFNNLLTVILGNLELTRFKLAGNAPLLTRIDRATWAAQRGATLTSQLLTFARKQPLAPTVVDLTATVAALIPFLHRTLGEHIAIRFVESASLWPVLADAAQLESALLNLALNARDAMENGGRLTIELANQPLDADYAQRHPDVQPGDYTMLVVSDTGDGMGPDILGRVFEPFFTTKPDGRGTGLGLPMVFGFVQQSGGHIKIYSEPGQGTVVRVYLPRATAGTLAAPQTTDKLRDAPQGTATVLVVEDEPAVREIAVAILRDLGYRVLEAGDAEEALRIFGAHVSEIDLLLSDVVLPGEMRGGALAKRIAAVRPDIRVLFMSGYTENSIVHQGRIDDGVQLIGKPFHREQLARKVAEMLGTLETADALGAANVIEMKPRSALAEPRAPVRPSPAAPATPGSS